MRVLITGISGFAGAHLAAYASRKKNVRLFGTSRAARKASASDGAEVLVCDMRDRSDIRRVLRRSRPDRIFHLAAQASVPFSWKNAAETFEINLMGTLNLFEELKGLRFHPRVHIAGSSQEYGEPGRKKITERCELRPLSPYAASKIAQEYAACVYEVSAGIPVVRTRAFNHTGPGQREEFVVSGLARQVAEIEAGLRPPVIAAGNLASVRDFTDVRDVARAYWLALDKGVPGEVYNICSGVGRRIREVADYYTSRSRVKFRVTQEASRLRKHDVTCLLGSADKFKKRTGWRPEIAFHSTLDDVLEHWRQRVKTSSR